MSSHLQSPNLLLIGPDAATRERLAELMPSVASPILCCDGAEPDLPNYPVGSLIVRDVDRLTRVHQEQLAEWLNRHGHAAQVIAISAQAVFPRVTRGEFSEALYYRINTVTLVLDDGTETDGVH